MVEYLYNRIGEHLQAVMFHPCARLDRWPEMDILRVMHNCYTNARDLLNSNLIADSVERPRATEIGAQSIAFRAWVLPFFGNYVRNQQILLWARRNLELMTMLINSSENAFSYGFSQQFVNKIAVPLNENYRFMLINLLKVDPAKVTNAYVAVEADFAAYAASTKSVDANLIQSEGTIDPLWVPTANDRTWCAGAYTFAQIAPLLKTWPENAAPAIAEGSSGSGSTSSGASGSGQAAGGINTTT
jgi:hypothetical protein